MKKLFFLLFFLLPFPALAFNQNYIISDQEMADYDSMTLAEIKDFLGDRGSFLSYYADFYTEDGTYTEAAEIIWKVAQKFQINPKFLLTLLEKEQGLVSGTAASQKRLDWAMGYGVCDKCYLSHPGVAKYRGFANQVYYAAQKFKNGYLVDLENKGVTQAGFGPGVTKLVDYKYKVKPANDATAALYTYTPHVSGNRSFYILWKNWFSNIVYPDGSLLQDIRTGGVYLIEDGKKRPFLSKEALTSNYNINYVVQVVRAMLDKFPTGTPISDVADGSLQQLKTTGGVYWVSGLVKYPIWDKGVLKARFPSALIKQVDLTKLTNLTTGNPVKLLDGTLVKDRDSPAVYFISDGKLRPVTSEETFLAYNWEWSDIVLTSNKILGFYEIGDPIAIDEAQTLEIMDITFRNGT